jgi:uncharacterized membrane protein
MGADRGGLSPARIETLVDGVFAIAMTILVLELHAPEPAHALDLGASLVHLWPKVASYAVSFVILGTLWIGHHYQFHYIRRSNRALLWINLVFLLFVSFLPFATALVGSFPRDRVAVLVYGGTLMGAGSCLAGQWGYASWGGRLLGPEASAGVVRALRARVLAGTIVYGVALGTAIFRPGVALVMFIVMPVLYLFPSGIDRHVRAGGR